MTVGILGLFAQTGQSGARVATVVAIISLMVSLAAFVLAVVLPVWERYSRPKVVLRPPSSASGRTGWSLRVVNRRREPLAVRETWIEFDDGHRMPLFYVWHNAFQKYCEIPARASADFQAEAGADGLRLLNPFDHTVSLAGFCEEGVGHVSRSRPLDASTEPVALTGRRRLKSWWQWQKRRIRA